MKFSQNLSCSFHTKQASVFEVSSVDKVKPNDALQSLYTSTAPAKGIGRRYSVFPDRVELKLRILNETITIPAEQIRAIYLVPGGITEVLTGTLKGRYPWMALVWGLAMDAGVLGPHVLLKSAAGPVRYFRFTPEEPARFVEACRCICRQ